jgi:hypothetical protein
MAKQGMTDYGGYIAAGNSITFNVEGDSFHVITAASAVQLSFDDGKQLTRYQGMGGVAPSEYKKVTITSEAAQSVVIALGTGGVFDSRSNLSATINTSIAPANVNTPLGEVTIGAGATALLSAADATRKEIRIGVKSDNPGGVYIGDSGTGATTPGGYIEIGGVDYVSTEAAIYAYNPHPTDSVVVNLMTLRRV